MSMIHKLVANANVCRYCKKKYLMKQRMIKNSFVLIFLTVSFLCFSQEVDFINSRLQALNNNGKIYYNIDGYNFTSQTLYNKMKKV